MVFSKTAYDVWKEEKNTPSIITLCKDLDQAIGDGIKRGVITELVGAPGSGKTQLWYAKHMFLNLFILQFK